MKASPIEIKLLRHMGDDTTVVEAARRSMWLEEGEPCLAWIDNKLQWYTPEYLVEDKKEYTEADNARLIHYLAEHGHWSPFAHCFASFHIKAPIFVARQLQKHTVGLAWNEFSRRYRDIPPEYFVPELRARAENVKQGSKDEEVAMAPQLKEALRRSYATAHHTYSSMIKKGVAPEVARAVLPQAMMTEWIWSGSLYAFARVCNLRLDHHAQKESRIVAMGIYKYLKDLFPVSIRELVHYDVDV